MPTVPNGRGADASQARIISRKASRARNPTLPWRQSHDIALAVAVTGLERNVDAPMIVDGDALHVVQIAAEAGNWLQAFLLGVAIQPVLTAVGYVEDATRVPDQPSLGIRC